MITRALIVICSALAILLTIASHSKAEGLLDGMTAINVTMHRLETCTASQYGVGDGYHGKRTADGSIFNTFANNPYTVAHITRPLGSWVIVTNLANGRSIRAKVTDRGPFYHARCVDLGRAGADAIGMGGTARVSVE